MLWISATKPNLWEREGNSNARASSPSAARGEKLGIAYYFFSVGLIKTSLMKH